MANEEHLRKFVETFKQGVEVWNQWREDNPDIRPDLSGANLSEEKLNEVDLSWASLGAILVGLDLSEANLSRADFYGANLHGVDFHDADLRAADFRLADLGEVNLSRAVLVATHLYKANLSGADLSGADLSGADLSGADLRWANLSEADVAGWGFNLVDSRANLREADLRWANLSGTDLSGRDFSGQDLTGTNLSQANLNQTILVSTNLSWANLSDCSIYGIAAWNLNLEGAKQSNLVITPPDEPIITVDNLQVAQFIYLLLDNKQIRDIIDTITSKVVLILGRFTPARKAVLDAIREELRERGYLPILFDFEKPSRRDLTETVSTLAHMSRFVIADITDAKSIPQELERIVPGLPSVPVQPLIASSEYEYAMFEHYRRYPWVLDAYRYDSIENLLASLKERVIDPAEMKANELTKPTSSALLPSPSPKLEVSDA